MQVWVITLICTIQILFLPSFDELLEVSVFIFVAGWVLQLYDIFFNSGK